MLLGDYSLTRGGHAPVLLIDTLLIVMVVSAAQVDTGASTPGHDINRALAVH